jgi:hypothetical protein
LSGQFVLHRRGCNRETILFPGRGLLPRKRLLPGKCKQFFRGRLLPGWGLLSTLLPDDFLLP